MNGRLHRPCRLWSGRAPAWPVPKRRGAFCITGTTVDGDGLVREAKIVPPTSQNQRRIEQDLRLFMPRVLNLSNAGAALACERVIRCYDPCISCAAHFLRLSIERVP